MTDVEKREGLTAYEFAAKALQVPKNAEVIDKTRPLPRPSRDPDALKQDFRTHGYCMISEALSEEDTIAVRSRVDSQIEAEAREGCGMPASPNGTFAVSNLLNKGDAIRKVVTHSLVDMILAEALGEGFLISTCDAIQAVPGSKSQGLHIDQFNFGIDTNQALVTNAGWMLDAFTEENGGTRIIPGSHLWPHEQILEAYEGLGVGGRGSGDNLDGTIAVEGPAGTCFVFHGRLLHGAGQNRTLQTKRTALFCLYCRPWIRPFENPFLSISDDILGTFPQELLNQLGYRPWGLSGGYQTPGVAAPLGVIRPKNQVRELL